MGCMALAMVVADLAPLPHSKNQCSIAQSEGWIKGYTIWMGVGHTAHTGLGGKICSLFHQISEHRRELQAVKEQPTECGMWRCVCVVCMCGAYVCCVYVCTCIHTLNS